LFTHQGGGVGETKRDDGIIPAWGEAPARKWSSTEERLTIIREYADALREILNALRKRLH
jgi:hypothetical protein